MSKRNTLRVFLVWLYPHFQQFSCHFTLDSGNSAY